MAMLYFTPKSASGPPGLWLADRMIPPSAPRARISADAAGVDMSPQHPTITRAAPFAAAIFRIVRAASRLKNRPSPPSTNGWSAWRPRARKVAI